jgi:hypothetical protein
VRRCFCSAAFVFGLFLLLLTPTETTAMTEQEWLQGTDPDPMLSYLAERQDASDRQLRLLVVGYARRHWDALEDSCSRIAIEIAERYADGKASARELDLGWQVSFNAARRGKQEHQTANWAAVVSAMDCGAACVDHLVDLVLEDPTPEIAAERAVLCDLLRDVFGNPFRTVEMTRSRLRSWLRCNDGTVRNLARTTYDERAFDRMPVLADALEEAGCDDEQILGHCQGAGPHVRGCFVLDLLLDQTGEPPEDDSPKGNDAKTYLGPVRLRPYIEPVPAKLAKKLGLTEEGDYWHRRLVCTCGKRDAFQLKHSGEVQPDGMILSREDTLPKFKVVCHNCRTSIDLFDPCRHGHEGALGFHRSEDVPGRRANRTYRCACGGEVFSVLVTVVYDPDPETLVEEFTEDTWDEAYGWFSADVICTKCKKVCGALGWECR